MYMSARTNIVFLYSYSIYTVYSEYVVDRLGLSYGTPT